MFHIPWLSWRNRKPVHPNDKPPLRGKSGGWEEVRAGVWGGAQTGCSIHALEVRSSEKAKLSRLICPNGRFRLRTLFSALRDRGLRRGALAQRFAEDYPRFRARGPAAPVPILLWPYRLPVRGLWPRLSSTSTFVFRTVSRTVSVWRSVSLRRRTSSFTLASLLTTASCRRSVASM